jgi:ATP-dependent RNA helicase RhlE
MSFNSLGLSDAFIKAISKRIHNTFSIQQKTIPPILEGKDVLASAQWEQEKNRLDTTNIANISGKH